MLFYKRDIRPCRRLNAKMYLSSKPFLPVGTSWKDKFCVLFFSRLELGIANSAYSRMEVISNSHQLTPTFVVSRSSQLVISVKQ